MYQNVGELELSNDTFTFEEISDNIFRKTINIT